MKNKLHSKIAMCVTVSLLSFFSSKTQAQFNDEAPWVSKNKETSKVSTSLTMDQMVTSFETYWKHHDKNKKGSGYKPFMRWEYQWRNNMHPDGTFITPAEIQAAWNNKKSAITSNKAAANSKVSNWEPVGPFTHTNTGSWS